MAKNNHKALEVGLGLAAVAAAAAGAYYFYGKNGAKNRKQFKGWVLKAKAEVMEKIEDMKEVTEQSYTKVVNEVMAKYKKLKKTTPAELAELTKELKSHWKAIKSEVDKASKKVGSKAR